MSIRKSLVLAALVAQAASVAWAGSKVEIRRLDLRRLPRIDCYFTATDDRGDYLLGLSEREITLLLDEVPQTGVSLESALTAGQSLGVVLLFDRSGSMEESLDEVRRAALDFVSRLSVDDRVAIISFDDEVRLETDFTADREVARGAISAIEPGSSTALWDALDRARELLDGVTTRRRAAVLFSDGRDTRSRRERRAVVDSLAEGAVPVFTLGLAEAVDEASLRQLAEATAGELLTAAEPADLVALYRSLAERLENEYLASFEASVGEDESWHVLRLVVEDVEGHPSEAGTEFLASRGPGISRERLASLETRLERRDWLLAAAIGAGAGLSLGLLVVLLAALLRPGIQVASWAGFGWLTSCAILGALLAVLLLGAQ